MPLFRQLRGLTRVQRNTFSACFLGWTLDSFDFFLLTFCLNAIAATTALGFAQDQKKAEKKTPTNPPANTSVTINDKTIAIKYSAPSMRGRKIFNGAGALQPDNTIWRAGANEATALHTDADP